MLAALLVSTATVQGDANEQKQAALPLYEQRLAYRRAVQALRDGRSITYRREAAKLNEYALRPYLVYYEEQGRLSTMRPKRAQELRTAFRETPIAERFYRQWLAAQVRRGNWQVYLDHYEPTTSAAGRCNYVRALYRSGERDAALAKVRDLWVSAESMPKTCDPLFKVWIAAGHLDQETVWARLMLALDAGEVGLARYLLRFLDRDNAGAGQLYVNVHTRPQLTRTLSRFPDTLGGRRAFRHGLLRYARNDAEAALALWRESQGRHAFSDADRRYIHERLTAAAAEDGLTPNDDPAEFSSSTQERIALAMVRHQRWSAAVRWIGALPADLASQPRWRYWLGHAKQANGDLAAGQEHLRPLAGIRTYYGFLAAGDLGTEGALNAEPLLADRVAQRALQAMPTVNRMVELYVVGDFVNARREWNFALKSLNRKQRRHLVELTAELGWVDQAIFGARDAELDDLVELRFPTPHLHIYRRYATEVDLPVHLLLAVSRQESAFHVSAVSHAGARGLMQLMPATARRVAERARIDRPVVADLADPNVNVRLGAHHFAALLQRYQGNRALAAAAYNAGEGNVKRWLAGAEGMPTNVWIERIPFRETRDYVKGVLAFQCVYSKLLGDPIPALRADERFIPS